MGHPPYCPALWTGWTNAQCWYDWQTLIAGLIAIFAAVIGATAVVCQTRQAKVQADQQSQARFLAARVTLPHRLTVICDYAERMTKELVRLHNGAIPNHIIDPFRCPAIEVGLVEQLEKAIAVIPDPRVNGLLADVIGEMQILGSRAKQLPDLMKNQNFVGLKTNLEDYILQSVQLHLMAGNLFPFARREVDSVPEEILWDAVRTKMLFLDIHESSFPQLYKTIARRSERNPAFWPEPK